MAHPSLPPRPSTDETTPRRPRRALRPREPGASGLLACILFTLLALIPACVPCEDCGLTSPCDEHPAPAVTGVSQTSPRAVDLLLVVDNSRGMADKQALLAASLPALIRDLTSPRCRDPGGNLVESDVQWEQGPLAFACPAGAFPELLPVLDMHVGVITSSLGGHGSDACSGAGRVNDQAHLIDRTDPDSGSSVPTYADLGFLAWDPAGSKSPSGEADLLLDSADPNETALLPSLSDLVRGAGESGCGYEAPLEAWYRFLVDPEPPGELILDEAGAVAFQGVDEALLEQRRAFLRPGSVLAIVMLTDEDDCSIREEGQSYLSAQMLGPDGLPFHLPRARTECALSPDDACCFSCAETGPLDADGEPVCPPDPSCKDADGGTSRLTEAEDPLPLRCFDQKRRFGVDFLYPIERYVDALSLPEIPTRSGTPAPNPLFAPGADGRPARNPEQVLLTGIVGVPWQLLARKDAAGKPDLLHGLGPAGRPLGGFQTSAELRIEGPDGLSTWDRLAGGPDERDPHLVASVSPRPGLLPPGSPDEDPIHGRERTIPKGDDLQYACTFPLPEPRDCALGGGLPACDCVDSSNDDPVCAVDPSTGLPTLQVRAKAYPAGRHLELLRRLGARGAVGSICAARADALDQPDNAYVPTMGVLRDRLADLLRSECLDGEPLPTSAGRSECSLIEARTTGSDACECRFDEGRRPVPEARAAAVTAIRALPEAQDAGRDCFCEIPELEGADLRACQDGTGPLSSSSADGFCYVRETGTPGLGPPPIAIGCAEGRRHALRFAGAASPRSGASLYLDCGPAGTVCEQERTPTVLARLTALGVPLPGLSVLTSGEGNDKEGAFEVLTDDDGQFELSVPEGQSIDVHVLADGEPVIELHLESGQSADVDVMPVAMKGGAGAAYLASVVCAGIMWVVDSKETAGQYDLYRHCHASCRATRFCGLAGNVTISILKELLDEACSHGPPWLKKKLQNVSACTGFSGADLAADGFGVGCSVQLWNTCTSCCEAQYPPAGPPSGCSSNAGCPAGQYCGYGFNAGHCKDKKPKRAICLHDFECQSNNCKWAHCK